MLTARGYILTAVSSGKQAAADKVSLDEQDRLAREFLKSLGIPVVKIFCIPGHSRYESDLERMFIDYRQQGITAYDDIADTFRNHLHEGDVLVMYHDSRAARSKTGFTWTVENWLRNGGRVYSIMSGGWIDQENEDFRLAMGAINATNSVKLLLKSKPAGMIKRAEQGKKTMSRIPFLFIEPRDGRNKPLPLAVDRPRYQRLIDDLYDVTVNMRTPWNRIEREIEQRGHRNRDGGQFSYSFFKKLMRQPTFHGHGGYGYGKVYDDNRLVHKFGMWMIDEGASADTPPDVTMIYNVHEAVYSGDQELQVLNYVREMLENSGRINTQNRYAFSSLLLCDECGSVMAHQRPVNKYGTSYRIYRCSLRARDKKTWASYYPRSCSQKHTISFNKICDVFKRELDKAAQNKENAFTVAADNSLSDRIAGLRSELTQAETRIANLTRRLADAPDATVAPIMKALEESVETRDDLSRHLSALELQKVASEQRQTRQSLAMQTILERGDAFWEQEETTIRSQLMALMGTIRFVVRDGEIIGTIDTKR